MFSSNLSYLIFYQDYHSNNQGKVKLICNLQVDPFHLKGHLYQGHPEKQTNKLINIQIKKTK